MNCPNCQSENKEGAKFCNECGFPLTGRIANVAAASTSDEVLRATGATDSSLKKDEALPPEEESISADSDDVSPEDQISGQTNQLPVYDGQLDSSRSDSLRKPAAQSSGPIDPSRLPIIGIKGVDVDEDGNEFDFSEVDNLDEEDGEESLFAQKDDFSIEEDNQESEEPNSGETVDFSSLDERLVDASYAPPQAVWRSGDTMEMPRVEGAAPPKQKEFRAPDPNEKKGGRKRLVVALVVLLLAAAGAGGFLTYQMELWGGKMLPDVSGMTQIDATYQLEAKGFTVRSTQVKSDETEGLVLLMDPMAGARADKGTEVVIHVAMARIIPDVVGKTKEEAASLFEEEGFDHVVFVEQKSDEAEGTVLSMDVEAGQKAKGTQDISVVYAVPFMVPDVVGQAYDAATTMLEESSYVVNLLYYYTEEVTEGLVVSSEPVAGEKLASGSTVTINVAKSRKAVLEDAAYSYLAGAGTIQLGGTTYVIDSVDAVSYVGNNQTTFSITGRAATTLDGETVYGSAKQKSGSIEWDYNNKIVSIA